jgi:4-alpha-glucanotransferase
VIADGRMRLGRAAGLLIPLFSMPSSRSWGIGEFADIALLSPWMRGAGLRLLQVLPLNEMAPGQPSPYSAASAMALDPIFISVPDIPDFEAAGGEAILDAGWRELLAHARAGRSVDYANVRALKDQALRATFSRFLRSEWTRHTDRAAALRAFMARQAWWLDDYAVYRAAHQQSGGRPWTEWPAGLRGREAQSVAQFRQEAAEEILYRQYLQWIAQDQWRAARARAGDVRVAGDFPFGVAADSADTWGQQEFFDFDRRAGAPPDAFSDQGQNWHLPVYRWDVMREDGYSWFRSRARRTADLFDAFRIDHVVGLFRTWVFPGGGDSPHFVPQEERDQAVQGESVLRAVMSAGAEVIAEDLGTIPDFVRSMLRRMGVPGYRVLRWERRWDEPGRPFIAPASYPALSVATSGTHDTETLAAWWQSADQAERRAVLSAIGPRVAGAPHAPAADGPFGPGVRDALLEALYASGSDLLVLPIQDVFGWTDRINVPATVTDSNWTWRLPWPVDKIDAQPEAAERQRALRRWAGLHRRA